MKRADWNQVVAWAAMFTILGTGRLRAGTNAWTSIGPQGGEIRALSVDPHNPRALYAATAYGGAFKSLDGGASWVKSDGPNRPLVFDPQDPDTIYSIDSTNPITGGARLRNVDSSGFFFWAYYPNVVIR
jgi:hypothetical protein